MKILKVIGVVLIAVVFVVIAGLLYINSGLPQYPVPEVKMQVVATAARIERGRKLSAMLCNSCHLNPTKGNLTGKRMSDAPAEFGIINSRNITQHKQEGIGDWSDAEIAVLLRTGINPRRGGVYVPPYMPKLAHLSDEDLASIISYLRSDDPILKADGTPSADSQPSFLVKLLCRVAFTPLEFPKSAIAQPDSTNARALGKYLADGALDCYGCHSADFKTVDLATPEKSVGYYGGGNAMLDINGNLMHTTNITSDKATGIGKWSEAEFVQAVQSGFRPDGSLVRYPMEQYKELTPRELSALYQFLMSTPAVQNSRKENFQYAAQGNAGEQAYYRYGCQYCHGTTGVGLADLRKAHTKFPADSVLSDVILNPAKYKRGVKMPQWSGVIKEQDIAPLCTFVRELAAK